MYTTLNAHYQRKFGCKVYKLAIDGGFTCPNRDGSIDTRGCIFCSAYGGGEFAEDTCGNVAQQLERAKMRVREKNIPKENYCQKGRSQKAGCAGAGINFPQEDHC